MAGCDVVAATQRGNNKHRGRGVHTIRNDWPIHGIAHQEVVAALHAVARARVHVAAGRGLADVRGPVVHAPAQVAGVRTFFEQNGLIEYAALSRMAVRDPKAYLLSTYPGGVALSSCYMKKELLGAVEVPVLGW